MSNETTRFQKGFSGNYAGRPRSDLPRAKLIELLEGNISEAIATIVDVMRHSRCHSDKLKAAMWILERVYGKAREVVEHGGRVEIAVNRPPAMSREEWIKVHGRKGIEPLNGKPIN